MAYIIIILSYLKTLFLTGLLGLLIYYIINIGNRYVDDNRKFKITKKHLTYFAIAAVSLFVLYYFFKVSAQITELITPVIYSIVFAYLLNPFVNLLERKRIQRLWGVLLIYILVIVIIVILSLIIFPKISNEFQELGKFLTAYYEEMNGHINELYIKYSNNFKNLPPEFQSIKDIIMENVSKIQLALLDSLRSITASIIGMFSKIFSFIIIPILTFYFLKDKEYFKKKICSLIPKKIKTDTLRISREIDSALGKFIRGQLIVALFVGIFTVIGLMLLGIDFALVIGLVAGIANFIPFFGPIIGIVPAIIFALLESPIKVIWVIILFVVIQQIESNILSPKIVGESVGLHPVVVIIALLIGASLMGIIGMLLAVPVAAIIKIVSKFALEKLTHS